MDGGISVQVVGGPMDGLEVELPDEGAETTVYRHPTPYAAHYYVLDDTKRRLERVAVVKLEDDEHNMDEKTGEGDEAK